MVKLTIITPVFNNVEYIEKCILNVASQTSGLIEHLIMDGGSTDGTVDLIEKYALKFKHIKWISEKDNGQSDAMNKGIVLARGEYISFLNVDDYYTENTLSQILSILAKDEALSFVVGDCNVWLPNGELLYVNKPRKLKTWHILSGYFFPVNPSAYFYRKEIHQKIGGYNVKNHFNMDVEFLIKASTVVSLIYYPMDWGNFRLLPNTKTVSDQDQGLLEKRKNELFQMYLDKFSLKIRLFTFCISKFESFKRNIKKIKKKLLLPFDMVYWKIRKTISHKKE